MAFLSGSGSFEKKLSKEEIYKICEEAFSQIDMESKKVIVLIPDNTRHAPIDLFFKTIYNIIGKKVKKLDYMVATGTHLPMTVDQIYKYLSIDEEQHRSKYPNVEFFSHDFNNQESLISLGKISAKEIYEISNGLFNEDINIPINKAIFDYDQILMITPIVPHEAMGFAGGNKYFFPGISSIEFIQTFHWIASTIGTPNIVGVIDTPPRRLINKAAEFIKIPKLCFSFVVNESYDLVCLYAGEPIESWSKAVVYSEKIHIKYVDKQYKLVLAITSDIYEELWVGSKPMYKLETIIADGGELIIYGPKMTEISFVHNEAIKKLGYHVPGYYLKQWEKFKNESKLIMAHSINVCGMGTFENGIETPRIQVTLATGISKETCESVNLHYMDYREIDLDEWRNKQDDNLLVVEDAGQELFKVKSQK
jgi:nickel-dependent lactate racemase